LKLNNGDKLGPYEILAPLGSGGMGEVYRARDTRLDRDVAVKVLPDKLARDADALVRFEREAKAVAALSHPNILAIHDFGQHQGAAFAVMELLEGQTVGEALADGPLPPRTAIDLARQAARGLGAAHDGGVVHRDLKPDNLFITRDGRVKILDFGLARTPEDSPGAHHDTPTQTSSTRRRVAGFDAELMTESFDISPDGKTLILSRGRPAGSVMLAENVPHVKAPVR